MSLPISSRNQAVLMQEGKARLVLADDHKEFLLGIRQLLGSDFDVVATAADGVELLAAVAEFQPDVVVTNIDMPRMNGIDAGRIIVSQELCSLVVVLTMHGDPSLARTALMAGVRGYVLKVHAGEQLLEAIQKVLEGGTFVSPQIAAKL